MGKTIRLKDDLGPGTTETFFKEVKEITKSKKKPKMVPFSKKERI